MSVEEFIWGTNFVSLFVLFICKARVICQVIKFWDRILYCLPQRHLGCHWCFELNAAVRLKNVNVVVNQI